MEAYTDIDSARSKIDTDTDWGLSKIDKRYTIGYCMLVGRNLVSWGKKSHCRVKFEGQNSSYGPWVLCVVVGEDIVTRLTLQPKWTLHQCSTLPKSNV